MVLVFKKKYTTHLLLLCVVSYLLLSSMDACYAQTANSKEQSANAARKLVMRVIPSVAECFVFEQINSDRDTFELESIDDKIIIRGNNSNSMAVGLNHYLKYYCHTSVSWYKDDSLYLPKKLPLPEQKISKSARCENRFFLNYCTFGYTMPWWKWDDWEWFIDWMALNGINMPLAITGQEAVWYNVWKKFGLTDEQIRSYFTGPAYLPWHRMANIDRWHGPIPQSWLDDQLELQKRIVTRERELGMTPVLPAFAGHVPEVLKNKYPNAKITSLGDWGGFEKKYLSFFLDPFDTLFNAIQTAFLSEQTNLFGTNHIYGTDPFNEVTPPSWETEYLASVSKSIYNSLRAVDPAAQWLQMSWIFYFHRKDWTNSRIEAFLKAVPQDKMILLDYFCENTEVWKMTDTFYGQPYIWCYLGNFGGNTFLAGNLREVETRMENAFKNGGSNMWGIGSTLEGFDSNPMMYEYVFEKVWSTGETDIVDWINCWAARRLGRKEESSTLAWQLLLDKVYNEPTALGQGVLTNARPSLTGHGNWTTTPNYQYNNADLFEAWRLLTKTKSKTPRVYEFDLVTIGRQALGNYFEVLRNLFAIYYDKKDVRGLNKTGKQMLELIDDINLLLSQHHSFLLGKWLEDAKQKAIDDVERKYYEQDARRIVTTWGAKGQSLNDYANRSWAGLMNTYYKPRWKMFINDVLAAVKNKKPFDEKLFHDKVTAFEWDWTQKYDENYLTKPYKDAISISKKLVFKYYTRYDK